MKRLTCPSTFDEAWETTISPESIAIPFTETESIRNSRDSDNWCAGPSGIRSDYMNPEDIALVVDKDEPGYHLILDTKANTAWFCVAIDPPCGAWEAKGYEPDRSNERFHYRNYPARPAVEVLEELVSKFRDLEWIPMRYDGDAPETIVSHHDEAEDHPNAVRVPPVQSCEHSAKSYTYAIIKDILHVQFGWPDNFDKEGWNRKRKGSRSK
ncbi:hypothetical protein T440DRAFT_518333 [Plenodomus tracheiphilus IPT5]|uniref:Uncharacterized protein n=1 Tax=Plenodomus tracheiphilus IPT5 TaxID=1408161 RepID=A0A6A7B7F3_9PLEO|nr:hypothetical protein T440DRAFT_518333 [Plenodomus tracheiphilus IPT5]